jgi:hypothetical protein
MVRAIFEEMRARGMVRSGRAFSRDWLDRAPNYTCAVGFDRLAPGALLHLHRRLLTAGEADLAARLMVHLIGVPAMDNA